MEQETKTGGREFLTFGLGDEEYGIDILNVQEIRGYENVTRVAGAPEHVKGVINLRGVIVPVIDMRIRLNMAAPTYDQFTVVIILNLGRRVVGMVVDGVSDVIELGPEQVKPAPELGNGIDTKFIFGIGTVGERMLVLVDISSLLLASDFAVVGS